MRFLLPLLSLILLLPGCASWQQRLQEPTISLVGLEIRELVLLRQRYALTLTVHDPHAVARAGRGLRYGLHLGGEPFATGLSAQALAVPAYGETYLEVEMPP